MTKNFLSAGNATVHGYSMKINIIHLQVQELRGNIRVFCRCRYDDSDMCALKFEGDERVICTTVQGRKKVFEFEKMYTPDTSQEIVSYCTFLYSVWFTCSSKL